MVPTPSCPPIKGRVGSVGAGPPPFREYTSPWHTPLYDSRTRASANPGRGTGTEAMVYGWPYGPKRMAAGAALGIPAKDVVEVEVLTVAILRRVDK